MIEHAKAISRPPDTHEPLTAAMVGVTMLFSAVAGSVAGAVPTMVLADEPTSRQDRGHADLVIAALTEVTRAGAAVVVATDDEPLAAAARVVVLD